jgi:hypothetical protein
MCAQSKNSGVFALLLPLNFQFMSATFTAHLINNVKQARRTSKDLQHKIWSTSFQLFSSIQMTQQKKSIWFAVITSKTGLRKKCTGRKMGVWFFSTTFVRNIFRSDKYLVSYAWDACRTHVGLICRVRYYCLILTKTGMCWHILIITSQYKM